MKAKREAHKQREHRALISARFKALCADTGLGVEGVGKLLHVTSRTVRNWLSGHTSIPYSAYKLLRLLRFMELLGKGFEGWCMHSGRMWTPERHPITPEDGGWWSLLVRQARAFRVLYAQQVAQRIAAQAAAYLQPRDFGQDPVDEGPQRPLERRQAPLAVPQVQRDPQITARKGCHVAGWRAGQ